MIRKIMGLLLAVILLGVAAMAWNAAMQRYVVVNWKVYPRDTTMLDLRDRLITWDEHDTLAAALPGVQILWNVPFQGSYIPSDTRELKLYYLTQGDLGTLDGLRFLEKVDGSECEDYAEMALLYRLCPNVRVEYTVPVDGQLLDAETEYAAITELTWEDAANLECLPKLKTLDASACEDAAILQELAQAHPGWEIIFPEQADVQE